MKTPSPVYSLSFCCVRRNRPQKSLAAVPEKVIRSLPQIVNKQSVSKTLAVLRASREGYLDSPIYQLQVADFTDLYSLLGLASRDSLTLFSFLYGK